MTRSIPRTFRVTIVPLRGYSRSYRRVVHTRNTERHVNVGNRVVSTREDDTRPERQGARGGQAEPQTAA